MVKLWGHRLLRALVGQTVAYLRDPQGTLIELCNPLWVNLLVQKYLAM